LDISFNKLASKKEPQLNVFKFVVDKLPSITGTICKLTLIVAIELNISSSNIKAEFLRSVFMSSQQVTTLDLSENDFDDEGRLAVVAILTLSQKSPM
jgi:hypothetical protein